MRCLKLKEVSEMVFQYSRDHHVDLLTAYEHISSALGTANPYKFEAIKKYLFDNPIKM